MLINKYLILTIFLFIVSNTLVVQAQVLDSGGNPGAVNRNYSEQVQKLEIDRNYIETVPADLDAERKRREAEQKQQKDVQRGGVIYNPKFKLNKILFEGNTIYSDAKLKAVGKNLTGKEIYLEDILDYAVAVSRFYQKNGYLTTYAYIPPQEIEGGVVKIVVSESEVGEKKVSGNFWVRKFYIEKIATGGTHLSTGKVFNVRQLQGAVKSINRETYMSTVVGIEKDSEENTVLDFEMKDRFPIRLSMTWDDFGRDLIGRQRFSTLLGSENLTGFGDKIYGGPILADRSFAAVAGYQIPVSYYGTTLGFDYSFAHVRPGGAFAPLGIVGDSNFLSLILKQPIINDATTDFVAYAAFDWINATSDITTLEERIVDYTLRVPRVGLNLMRDDLTGRWIANTEANFGIDGLGSSGNVPGGSQTSFQRFIASLIRVQRLPWDSLGIVRVNGQYSPQALFPSMQMYIGGPYNIWGFQPSELLGDWGVAGGEELRFPVPYLRKVLPERSKYVADSVRLMVFHNWGFVKDQSNVVENPLNFLQSVGFGTYIRINNVINILIGVGFPIGAVPSDASRARMFFSINGEFDNLLKPRSHSPNLREGIKDHNDRIARESITKKEENPAPLFSFSNDSVRSPH